MGWYLNSITRKRTANEIKSKNIISLVSIAKIDNIIKRNLGRVHFSLQFYITVHSSGKSGQTQIGQEPGSKNGWRGHRGVLLYWLALHDFFHLFSLAPRNTGSGVAPVSWAHLHHYKVAQRSIKWGHFLNCHSLFQNHSRLCQLDIKLGSTHHVLRNCYKINHSKHVTIVCLSHDIKEPTVRKRSMKFCHRKLVHEKLVHGNSSWLPQLLHLISVGYCEHLFW